MNFESIRTRNIMMKIETGNIYAFGLFLCH